MPNTWGMIDAAFPTFTGKETFREQVEALQDYLTLVVEELKYQLANLNTKNWNKTALENFQKDTTADTDEKVSTLAEQLEGITNRLSSLSTSISGLAGTVAGHSDEIGKLWEGLELLGDDIDGLNTLIARDESGAVTIGAEGQVLQLVGNVYINGVLITQEG